MPKPRSTEPGLLGRLPQPPRKVAVLRASRIGDFICATPAFRALRAALPEASLTLITLPMLEGLARRLPYFNHIVPFPGYPGLAEQFFEPRRASAFFQMMQAEQFDLAIQMQGSGVNSNPFTLMLGARCTAGYTRRGEIPNLLDAALELPGEGHEVERALALTRFLGIPDQGLQTEFPLWPADYTRAKDLLGDLARPLIGVHAAARDKTRRWPPERFADAVQAVLSRHGGSVVILAEEAEKVRSQALADAIRSLGPASVLDLTGQTSLAALGGVITGLDLLLTNDSGPAHIAYALNTPTVTIFGGGDPARYAAHMPGPFAALYHEIECRPCDYRECPIGYVCLNQVSVEQVVTAGSQLLVANHKV